jgi:hypothetical protein
VNISQFVGLRPPVYTGQALETEVLAWIGKMQDETPFGSVASEQKIVQLLGHVEHVWLGPGQGKRILSPDLLEPLF